jgi:hypothetical protein
MPETKWFSTDSNNDTPSHGDSSGAHGCMLLKVFADSSTFGADLRVCFQTHEIQVPVQRMVPEQHTVMVPRTRMVPVQEMVPQTVTRMVPQTFTTTQQVCVHKFNEVPESLCADSFTGEHFLPLNFVVFFVIFTRPPKAVNTIKRHTNFTYCLPREIVYAMRIPRDQRMNLCAKTLLSIFACSQKCRPPQSTRFHAQLESPTRVDFLKIKSAST